MNIVKRVFVAVAIMATVACGAQTLDDFRVKLSLFERNDDGEFMRYANVVINEDSLAREAFEALRAQNAEYDAEGVEIVLKEGEKPQPKSMNGYRIGVFFDNSARARAAAMAVVEKFESTFEDIPVTMSYDNPYFKVSAGYCTTPEEAVMMLRRVQRVFPTAYLMRDVITTDDLIEAHRRERVILEEKQRVADSIAMAEML